MSAETPRRQRARQRTVYCSAEERAAIGRRARAAGMRFSPFVVACALRGAEALDATDAPRLVLSEAEQRQLHERVALLDRCAHALLERVPGTEMSAFGALAFLVGEARSRGDKDARERE